MIYVDTMLMTAAVYNPGSGRTHRSRWSHLFSDSLDPTELHEFAHKIGLRREWFQEGRRLGRPSEPDPVKDHYDVTESKRRAAIRAGAIPVERDQAVAIWRTKRDLYRSEILESLGDVRVMFWVCPVKEHRDRGRTDSGLPLQTVEWRGRVAYCLFPGCDETSAVRG